MKKGAASSVALGGAAQSDAEAELTNKMSSGKGRAVLKLS